MTLENLTLTREERIWLEAYQKTLEAQFADLVKDIIIFGSKARGSSNEDSDLDVLVVIHKGNWKTKKSVADPGYMLAIGTEVVPSLIVLTAEEWIYHQDYEAPFWQTVTRDGIPVFHQKTEDFAAFGHVAEAFKDVDDLSAKIDQAVEKSKTAHNRPATS